MTINDYIDACIHFNSDTQLWHELDPHKYYYAPDASADWWREDCDHSAPRLCPGMGVSQEYAVVCKNRRAGKASSLHP